MNPFEIYSHKEWDDIPERLDNEVHGLQCVIKKTPMGHLCGYVGVDKDHPYYQMHYDDVDVDVHGGLSFAGELDDSGLWFFGFDCAHAGDYVPQMNVTLEDLGLPQMITEESYKGLPFVMTEVGNMAKQLANYNRGLRLVN